MTTLALAASPAIFERSTSACATCPPRTHLLAPLSAPRATIAPSASAQLTSALAVYLQRALPEATP